MGGEIGPMERNNAEFITEKHYQDGFFILSTNVSTCGEILEWFLLPRVEIHKKPLWIWGLASTERPLNAPLQLLYLSFLTKTLSFSAYTRT